MQRHVKQRGTARIGKRWLGRGCLRLAVERKILKEASKSPALDAVVFVAGFEVVPPAIRSRLWIVTEQESGWHLHQLISLVFFSTF